MALWVVLAFLCPHRPLGKRIGYDLVNKQPCCKELVSTIIITLNHCSPPFLMLPKLQQLKPLIGTDWVFVELGAHYVIKCCNQSVFRQCLGNFEAVMVLFGTFQLIQIMQLFIYNACMPTLGLFYTDSHLFPCSPVWHDITRHIFVCLSIRV